MKKTEKTIYLVKSLKISVRKRKERKDSPIGNFPLGLDMRHIQYQGETLPPSPLLAFHLVLPKFHI